MPNIMTVKEFRETLKISENTALKLVNSAEFRKNKIARKVCGQWRIDWCKYRKIVWGGLEDDGCKNPT